MDADVADPGEVEKIKAQQRQAQSGKYGSVRVKPHKRPKSKEEKKQKKSWVEIKLLDEENRPVGSEKYRITLPDESVVNGTLDGNGFARVNNIEPGNCLITFPELDDASWARA